MPKKVFNHLQEFNKGENMLTKIKNFATLLGLTVLGLIAGNLFAMFLIEIMN